MQSTKKPHQHQTTASLCKRETALKPWKAAEILAWGRAQTKNLTRGETQQEKKMRSEDAQKGTAASQFCTHFGSRCIRRAGQPSGQSLDLSSASSWGEHFHSPTMHQHFFTFIGQKKKKEKGPVISNAKNTFWSLVPLGLSDQPLLKENRV